MRKVFVETLVKCSAEGQQVPLEIVWEDGRSFGIDKITEIKKAASLKVGGQGLRYTCRVHGKETYLFLEEDRWFMEGR